MIGIPDEEAGELPKAFVVRQPGANITAEQIIQYVTGILTISTILFVIYVYLVV